MIRYFIVVCELARSTSVAIGSGNKSHLTTMMLANSLKPLTRYRIFCSVVIAILVALGLGSKVYSGWAQGWVNHSSGDVLYEMLWIWLVGSWRVRWSVKRIVIATFLITAIIEFTQLIPFPAVWQAQLWWRLLLGSTFTLGDFFHYAIGCILGAFTLIWTQRRLIPSYKTR